METFANRVNNRLMDMTGGLGIWDLVGDWPESTFSAQNDLDGAIAWIVGEAADSGIWL